MKKLKAFRDLTKDNFEYVVSTLAIIKILYDSTIWLISNLQKANIYVFITTIFVVIILIFVLRKNILTIFNSLVHTFATVEQNDNLTQQSKVIEVGKEKIDFDKIIPKTSIVDYLMKEARKLAKKQLSNDCILQESSLWINYYNDKIDRPIQQLNVYLVFKYYSEVKHMTIWYSTVGLNAPTGEYRNLAYSDTGSSIEPFTVDRKWRQAAVAALEDSESELIGRRCFTCHISNEDPSSRLWINIAPEGPVNRSYIYNYKDGILYRGRWEKNNIVKQIK